jgi:uncharacterized protein YkwD
MSTSAQCLFQQQMLDAHNAHRADHGVPALELDDELNLSAQAYAEKLADMNQLVHSGTQGLGENLYEMCSSEMLTSVDGKCVRSSSTYFFCCCSRHCGY